MAKISRLRRLAAPLLMLGCGGETLVERAPTPASLALVLAPVAQTEALPPRGGYWLGVDLVGPAAAQQAATAELSKGLVLRDPVDRTPPGILVGYVDEVRDAIRWIDTQAFEPRARLPPRPLELQRGPAPIPAGRVRAHPGATLVAFVISGATPDLRRRTIEWPLDQAAVLPPGSTWLPAALVPDQAPLFAAPAPTLPPAAERHATARRRGGLFVLGWFDRCDPQPQGLRCLRWAQVIARDGDRLTPGYLPMAQVALRTAWVHGEGPLPRAQLIPTGLAAGQAQWVLLARGLDNQLHRRTVQAPGSGEAWPHASLRVEGEFATILLGDEAPLQLPLDASLDARP